jgi:hypothetical protein
VVMQVKSGSTTTYYPSSLEEVTGSTLTKYYSVAGLPLAINVGATFSYLASDSLNSVSEAFSSSGVVMAQQLYTPYGSVRYSSGTMPTWITTMRATTIRRWGSYQCGQCVGWDQPVRVCRRQP